MSSKSLIILEDRSQIDKLISLAKGKPILIALNRDVSQELASRGVEFKAPKDYGFLEESEEYLDVDDKGFKWLRSFINIKVRNNRNIKEILTYDGVSIWWLVEEQIYNNQFVFHRVGKIVKQVFMLDHIIRAEDPTMTYYAKNDTPASIVIGFICKSRNITTTTICRSFGIKRYLSQKLKAVLYIYGQWLRIFLRKTYWMLLDLKYRSRIPRGRRKILIFSGPSWANVYDLATGELRKGDLYFGSIIDLLRNESEIVFVDIPTTDWGLATMKEKKQQQDIIRRPFEYYLNIGIILKALKASKNLHRDYQLLRRSASFRDSLNYDGLPLYDLIGQNLSFFFSRQYLTMIIAFIEMAKRMVEIENPDAIMLGGESFSAGRAIIAQAKSKGIPTLLLAHAMYYRYHLYFNHIDGDIGPNKEATAPYCPIPDKFAMYDQYTKDILVSYGKIRDADVVVTGVPRYDVLTRADKVFNREKIFNRLGLDRRKRLVTWMAQPSSAHESNINAVYNAVKSLQDVQLVIKLHPSQDQKGMIYRKDKSFKPLIIGGYGVITFELLYASDIVISWRSTTALEALILDKPLIIVDLVGKPVLPPYVEYGAAIYIDKEDALIPAIESILYDKETRQKLAVARDRFLSEIGYRQDEQASQRVADLILQMREDSKKVTA